VLLLLIQEAQKRNISETEDLREVIVEKIVEIYHQDDEHSEVNCITVLKPTSAVINISSNASKNSSSTLR
jgi:hypothetical protein